MAAQLTLDATATATYFDRVCLLCGCRSEGCDGIICHVYDAD